MRILLSLSLSVMVLLAYSPLADAGIITNSVEIDLNLASITDDGSGGKLIFGSPATAVSVAPFTVQVGDILQTTITFKNGDRLQIIDGPNTVDGAGPDYFESLVFYFGVGSTTPGGHSTSTSAVTFSNLQGTLSDPTPGSSSTGVLAQALGFDFTTSNISFDGLTLTTTINSLPVSAITYDSFGLWGGRAGGYEIVSANSVPEPSSLALLGMGVTGLCGYCSRRKRYQAA